MPLLIKKYTAAKEPGEGVWFYGTLSCYCGVSCKSKDDQKISGSSYTVAASQGHVRDLPKSTFGIDIEMITNRSILQSAGKEIFSPV